MNSKQQNNYENKWTNDVNLTYIGNHKYQKLRRPATTTTVIIKFPVCLAYDKTYNKYQTDIYVYNHALQPPQV